MINEVIYSFFNSSYIYKTHKVMVRNRLLILTSVLISFFTINAFAGSGGTEKFKAIGPQKIICTGKLITLSSNGSNFEEYLWFPTKHFANNTLKTVTTTIIKTTTFHVVKIDVYSHKTDTAVITVEVNEEKLEILGENFLCSGDSAHLLLPPAFKNPVWSNGGTTRGIWISKPGIYRVEAQGDCNFAKGAIHIKEINDPVAVITTLGSLNICKGQQVKLTAFGIPNNYQWSTGKKNKDITVTETKEIELAVYNECGVARDVKSIRVQEVDASFIPSKLKSSIPFTLQLINESKTQAKDKWFMNGVEFSRDTDPALLIEVEGEYNIELVRTSKYGCENKMKYASIIALPKIQPAAPDKLNIAPNSFSPNGDGLNDKFQFESNFIQDIKFVVFNRWGHEIYQSDGGTGGWDGRIGNGDFASAGKYVVVYKYLDLDGRPVSQTMELNLIR